MKALSLHQPHATAIAALLKRYETRGRRTSHRGWFAVHASQNADFDPARLAAWGPAWAPLADVARTLDGWHDTPFPRGAVVAVARLLNDHATEGLDFAPADAPFGDFSAGRRAYELADVRHLPLPVPCRGWPGWFTLDDPARGLVLAQLPAALLPELIAQP